MSIVNVSDSPAAVLPQSPLEATISGFLLGRQSRGVTPARMRSLEQFMSEWREFCSTHQVESLTDLTPSVIRTYVLWMQEQRPGRKAQTFNMRIIAIKGFLRFCAEDRLLPDNLAHVIRRLPEEKRDVEPLSEEQVSALIGQPDCTSFTGLRDRLIMQLLYDTGVRVTELVNVGVPDIDFEAKLITIRRGKGRKQRVVPFGKDCQATLIKYLAERGDLEHTVLLVTHDRRPYISDGLARQGANLVQTMVTRTAKRARIARKVHPHLFRHTFAVHYLVRILGRSLSFRPPWATRRSTWCVATSTSPSETCRLEHHLRWISYIPPPYSRPRSFRCRRRIRQSRQQPMSLQAI